MDYTKEIASDDKTALEYRNGPIPDEHRSCTDKFCLFVFILFLVGLGGIAWFSFKTGSPYRLLQGYDPDYRACGFDAGVEDYPLIYFVSPYQAYLYRSVCVKACPNASEVSLDCAVNSLITSCLGTSGNNDPATEILIYDSVPFGNRVCLPTDKGLYSNLKSQVDSNTLQTLWSDVKEAKWIILASVIIAFILSFFFLCFLDQCAPCLVWSLIIFIILLFLAMSANFYLQYQRLMNVPTVLSTTSQSSSQGVVANQAQDSTTNPMTYLILCFVFLGLAALFTLLTCCYRRTIQLTIAILKTGSAFVEENKTVLYIPFVVFALTVINFAFWVTTALFLYSTGNEVKQKNGTPFGSVVLPPLQQAMGVFHLLGLVFVNAALLGTVEFITSGVVSIWYFQQGKSGQYLEGSTWKACHRYFRYHMGSVAFGSFLLTLIFGIRLAFKSLPVKTSFNTFLSQKHDNMNPILDCCVSCCNSVASCFENINKNAYVQVNMTGKAYWSSGREAAKLMLRNGSKYIAVLSLGELIIGLGRFFVFISTGFISTILIRNIHSVNDNLTYPMCPIALTAIIGFIIGSIFMSTYGISITAILHIFCMDEEMEAHFGKQGAALCPPGLQEFLDEHHKKT